MDSNNATMMGQKQQAQEAAISAVKAEAVSTTQSKVIETTNMTTSITSENIIKNDKYISDIGSTLIPFSQLSNKQFNQYLRAIGR